MGVFLRDFEGLFVCLLFFFFSRIDRLQLPIWCYCHLPCLAGQSIILSILCGPFFFFFFCFFFFLVIDQLSFCIYGIRYYYYAHTSYETGITYIQNFIARFQLATVGVFFESA